MRMTITTDRVLTKQLNLFLGGNVEDANGFIIASSHDVKVIASKLAEVNCPKGQRSLIGHSMG